MTIWHPISEAPVRDLLNEGPYRCLVYGPDIGVKMGAVWRYTEKSPPGASADSFCGDWNITHFSEIPSPPTTDKED